ncbi:cinnamoyl-CoA reductase 2-like protein, partial [Tanacetum coccineum]
NGHLKKLENAEERLHLFKADLLDYEGLCDAFSSCNGVLHVASPVPGRHVSNPQLELLDPAILGTKNVLNACLKAKVEKVVVVSSGSAVLWNPEWPSDKEMDETCWTDIEYAKSLDQWYAVSKTLAEIETLKFAKRDDLIVIRRNDVYLIFSHGFKEVRFSEKSGRALLNSKKLLSLGWNCRPVDKTIVDTVKNYEEAGFLDEGEAFPSTI